MIFIAAEDGARYTPQGHDRAVTSRVIIQKTVDIHVTTFPAGTGMAEESHEGFNHLFYVLCGEMQVLQGGKLLQTLKKDDAVLIPVGEKHEIRNASSEEMTFLAINYSEKE